MKRSLLWLAALLVAFPHNGKGQGEIVDVMVNQIGSVPVEGLANVNFKFAIVDIETGAQATATVVHRDSNGEESV